MIAATVGVNVVRRTDPHVLSRDDHDGWRGVRVLMRHPDVQGDVVGGAAKGDGEGAVNA